jgi:hypothetical protein
MTFPQVCAKSARAISTRLYLQLLFIVLCGLGATCFVLEGAHAQNILGSVPTNFDIYVEPNPPPLPPAGGKFIDPSFGTEILRVTDSGDGANAGTLYSNWHTFNRDNTRLLYTGDAGPMTADFDATNFTVSNKRALPLYNGNVLPLQDGAAWSYLQNDRLWTVLSGRKLASLDLATNTYTVVADFGSFGVSGLDLVTNAVQSMHMDAHDEVFVFRVTHRVTGAEQGYFAYRRSTNQILFYRANTDVHHVLVDRSGRFVIAKYNTQVADQPNSTVVDLQATPMTFTDLVDAAPDQSPGGHGDVGTGVILGGAHNIDAYTWRSLADPHRYSVTLSFGSNVLARDPRMPGTNWGSPAHMSMLADDESFALYEFYACEPTTPFCDELALVENKPRPRVRRLLHHHSVYRQYEDSPRATISRDGRFVAFTSNWGGTNRRDLFIAKISGGPSEATPASRPRRVNVNREQ